jgi:MoaA/NifB/PqqE/SkfB family radical SAM enzyme
LATSWTWTRSSFLGIPTNATRALQHAKRLTGKVAYVNVGLEGRRAITQRVRGDYDKVMAGVRVFKQHGLPLSLSCVVLRSDLHGLPFTYQIADTLDAGKLKLIMPLRKGNALDLDEHEFISNAEAEAKFSELVGMASELYQKLDIAVLDVPLGYETNQRVEWTAGRIAAAGVVLPG